MRLKLYMAFAPSHVQFDFGSPRSRWGGEGSHTAHRSSFLRLNRCHDRRFLVLGPYDPPTSLIQGPPSPQHHHHHQRLLDDEAYRLRGEQNAACDGGARATVPVRAKRNHENATRAKLTFFSCSFFRRNIWRGPRALPLKTTISSGGGCGEGGRRRKGASVSSSAALFFV